MSKAAFTSDSVPPVTQVSARERIMQAARAHFFRLGFARITMADLARELGMSKKTLYQHFAGKEDLVDALIAAKAAELSGGFDAILAQTGPAFHERVGLVLQHALSTMGELSLGFLHDLQRFAPASYARLEEVRGRIAPRMWERLLREGIRDGAVRANTDPAATAGLILVVMQSVLHPDNLDRLQLEPVDAIRRIFNLIFSGILSDAGRIDYENATGLFASPGSSALGAR